MKAWIVKHKEKGVWCGNGYDTECLPTLYGNEAAALLCCDPAVENAVEVEITEKKPKGEKC